MDVLLRASKILKNYEKDKFLLAVSGGADSMALLTIFLHMREHFSFSFAVAHVHHGPGEYEKNRDQAHHFIEEFCKQKK